MKEEGIFSLNHNNVKTVQTSGDMTVTGSSLSTDRVMVISRWTANISRVFTMFSWMPAVLKQESILALGLTRLH